MVKSGGMLYRQGPHEHEVRRFDKNNMVSDVDIDEVPLERIPTAMEFHSSDSCTTADDCTSEHHSRYTVSESSYEKYLDGGLSLGSDDSGVGPFWTGKEDGRDWCADSFDKYEQWQPEATKSKPKRKQRKVMSLKDEECDPVITWRNNKPVEKRVATFLCCHRGEAPQNRILRSTENRHRKTLHFLLNQNE